MGSPPPAALLPSSPSPSGEMPQATRKYTGTEARGHWQLPGDLELHQGKCKEAFVISHQFKGRRRVNKENLVHFKFVSPTFFLNFGYLQLYLLTRTCKEQKGVKCKRKIYRKVGNKPGQGKLFTNLNMTVIQDFSWTLEMLLRKAKSLVFLSLCEEHCEPWTAPGAAMVTFSFELLDCTEEAGK